MPKDSYHPLCTRPRSHLGNGSRRHVASRPGGDLSACRSVGAGVARQNTASLARIALADTRVAGLVGSRGHIALHVAERLPRRCALAGFSLHRCAFAIEPCHAISQSCHLSVAHRTAHYVVELSLERADAVVCRHTTLLAHKPGKVEISFCTPLFFPSQFLHRPHASLVADVDGSVAAAGLGRISP